MKHPRDIDARAGRRLSRPPRARLSGRLHAVAGALAQAAGRALGRPGAVGGAAAGLRPRTRNREVRRPRILVAGRDPGDAARRDLRGAARRRRRQEDPAPRYRLRRRSRSLQAGAGNRRLHGRLGRGQAGPAQSLRRPSPPRRCSRRRAASSASRRPTPCGSRSGSTKASTSAARPSVSSPICAPTACRSPPEAITATRQVIAADYGRDYLPAAPRHYQTKAKNAQEAHEAIRPTDLGAPARARSRAVSIPTRPGSTS